MWLQRADKRGDQLTCIFTRGISREAFGLLFFSFTQIREIEDYGACHEHDCSERNSPPYGLLEVDDCFHRDNMDR